MEEKNKAFVLEAFETLFNKRDYVAAERFWSSNYVQHSAHIPPGRDGLFHMIKGLPDDFRYENGLVVANGDYFSQVSAIVRTSTFEMLDWRLPLLICG